MKKLLTFLFIALFSCSAEDETNTADAIYFNGNIYTAVDAQPKAGFVAVKGDRIIGVGETSEMIKFQGANTKKIDLNGKTLTPGFIESHAHIMGIGHNELNLDLLNTESYDEILEKVQIAAQNAAPGEWILGRGWHQSKWVNSTDTLIKGFPTHDRLSAVSPDNPVLIWHASGHAALANTKAMELAGVSSINMENQNQLDVEGGEIITDALGNPTGIFNERAMGVVGKVIPANDIARNTKALEMAIKACQRNGITSFHDAGATRESIDLFRSFKNNQQLGIRLYVMVTGFDATLVEEFLESGPTIDSTDHLLTIRSIKLNCDGALGSRGAWLLEPYSDRAGHTGMATLSMDYVADIATKGVDKGFQVCSHAIGDRANREILDRYESAFKAAPEKAKNHRFRIEHAQHISKEDIPRFAALGVIPAMQAIHMSSDRPWAIDRLGKERIEEGAYVWQKLLQSGAVVTNGTDAPVEPLNPIPSFYASVSRKTLKGQPAGGYEPEQKMTRQQALQSYTINAAFAAFEEQDKGSLEIGKLADFTIFDKDIMEVEESEILNAKVTTTVIGGKTVFE